MIAIQKIGKSFSGALRYNLKKLSHPDLSKRAVLLGSNFASMNLATINKEVELVKGLRPNLNRYVYHTSLNFPKAEQAQLSNEKLLAIALRYLEASGFSNNQYIIFRHHDSDHPHIHLLANRICFDGNVVSDSNNYKKSEAILRELEYQYNLTTVEQSSFVAVEQDINKALERGSVRTKEQPISVARQHRSPVSRKSPTRDEIALILRTGKSSNKLLLQELLIHLFGEKPGSISQFIRNGEKMGIYFLFNQASTGRVSGITYFFKDFKAKGQALGNQFKWAELIRKIAFNPDLDNAAIAAANIRTINKFELKPGAEVQNETNETITNTTTPQSVHPKTLENGDQPQNVQTEMELRTIEQFDETKAYRSGIDIQIADDIDDEAILGRNRHRQKKGRTNAR